MKYISNTLLGLCFNANQRPIWAASDRGCSKLFLLALSWVADFGQQRFYFLFRWGRYELYNVEYFPRAKEPQNLFPPIRRHPDRFKPSFFYNVDSLARIAFKAKNLPTRVTSQNRGLIEGLFQ